MIFMSAIGRLGTKSEYARRLHHSTTYVYMYNNVIWKAWLDMRTHIYLYIRVHTVN